MPMMYHTSRFALTIQAVPVGRTTAKYVFLVAPSGYERRELRQTQYYAYFATWEAAHAALLTRCQAEVERLATTLAAAETAVRTVEAMPPPCAAATP